MMKKERVNHVASCLPPEILAVHYDFMENSQVVKCMYVFLLIYDIKTNTRHGPGLAGFYVTHQADTVRQVHLSAETRTLVLPIPATSRI